MIQLPLEKLFSNAQIVYMQGIQAGLPKTIVCNLIGNNLSKTRKNLIENFNMTDGNLIPMPIVMVMWSPIYDIHVFTGEEALPFLRPYFKSAELITPPDMDLKEVVQGLVDIANGHPPAIEEFRGTYPFWNNGVTAEFKEKLNLTPALTQMNFSGLNQAVKKAQEV
jgi:hypothetical protein